VAIGIVQEFQFGLAWSDFSRFVGDVFGAPVAIEGLMAFFLKSTFLGLWIFGWDRCRRGCTPPASGWPGSAPRSRPTSSWPPTPGCSTRSASCWIRHAAGHGGQQSRVIRVFGLSPSGCAERHDAARAIVTAV